jgi:hypothetical protein
MSITFGYWLAALAVLAIIAVGARFLLGPYSASKGVRSHADTISIKTLGR